MRRIIYILILTLPNFLFGQEVVTSKSECDNYNKFLEGSELYNLKELSDTIYPNGKIYLDVERDVQFRELESITPFLGLGNDYSLQYLSTRVSRFDENIEFRRYEQYFKGVKVEGGGVTAAYRIPGDGPVGPNGPCDELYMLSPYLFTEINIDVNPQIVETQLSAMLNVEEIKRTELIVEQFNCSYRLIWKTDYHKDKSLTSWVDANTGFVLKTIESTQFKNAPTEDYGIQDLDDSEENNLTRLVSQDGSIITYDFDGTNLFDIEDADYLDNLIPTSDTNVDWQLTDADASVYQAHWVTSTTANFFDLLGIEFGTIHVGANCTGLNAGALFGSDLTEGFIVIGESNGSTLAEFDIIGHELGHIFLNEFLDYDEGGNASLHEGIADMLGVFIEMQQNNGTPDWEMGEDVPFIVRDLENPEFDCFDDVEGFAFANRHRRSTPLGHWFFTASTGGTPNIGVLNTLNIVLEALNLIGEDSDYKDLMEATLTVVEENFGRCSSEFAAINNAWENICVETGYGILNNNPCDFNISGPSWVCEESNYAKFCIDGGIPNNFWKWTIIGKKSTDFTSTGGMQGNGQNGGQCLTLIDFPDYPYYPQYITIVVWSSTNQKEVRKRVKIVDCDGDDPTCEEYYDNLLVSPGNNSFEQSPELLSSSVLKGTYEGQRITEYILYDLYGNRIATVTSLEQIDHCSLHNGIYIVVEINDQGKLISSSKKLIMR